jgi:hypothetical protein
LLVCLLTAVVIVGLGTGLAPAGAAATQALVSVGSPSNQHPQNAQNEPALAVDASRPDVLAAGANDLVDMQPCSRLAATTAAACSFPLGTYNLGVGQAGVYFSFDRGHSWTQPTYTGLTAADCSPTVEPCTPHLGPIHTVPNYFEAGLRSRSDPGVAFGPVPAGGKFSWANGSRLYYANLATNLTDTRIGPPVNTNTEVAVSHIDNVTADRISDALAWGNAATFPRPLYECCCLILLSLEARLHPLEHELVPISHVEVVRDLERPVLNVVVDMQQADHGHALPQAQGLRLLRGRHPGAHDLYDSGKSVAEVLDRCVWPLRQRIGLFQARPLRQPPRKVAG